jgi:hypothetical protein
MADWLVVLGLVVYGLLVVQIKHWGMTKRGQLPLNTIGLAQVALYLGAAVLVFGTAAHVNGWLQ